MFIGNWRKAECPTPTFRAWGSIHSTPPTGGGQGVGRAYHTKPHILQYYALHTNTILRTLPRLDAAVLHMDHQQQLRLLARRSTQACSHPPTRPHTDMIHPPTHLTAPHPPIHPQTHKIPSPSILITTTSSCSRSHTQDTPPTHHTDSHLLLTNGTITAHPYASSTFTSHIGMLSSTAYAPHRSI